jgi:hypothetical protein
MKQETSGVELRALLREAFVRLGDEPATEREQAEAHLRAGLSQRSAEDRSRTRQMVIEELARRKQAIEEATAATVDPNVVCPTRAATTQGSLFAGDGTLVPVFACAGHASLRAVKQCRSRKIQTDVRDLVEKCYRSLLRPFPEEHVILNPIANAEFIVRCRELGATVSETVLNRTLLNNRKAGRHSDLPRVRVCHLETGMFERIGHAVEIAASLVQREWATLGHSIPSVDDMLCDPEQRHALSVHVRALQEHVEAIECHLVLLAVRKSGRETSARAAGQSMPERTLFAPLRSLDPDDVPVGGGIYRVLCRRRPVFVSSTVSLRARISEHLQRGGPDLLPRSLPFQIDGPLSVEVFSLPQSAPRSDFDALTRRLRLQRTEDQVPAPPDLNWRESGALFGSHESVVRREALAC